MRKIKRGISVPRQPFYKIAFRRACEKTFQILQDARMGAAQCVIFLAAIFFVVAFSDCVSLLYSFTKQRRFFLWVCVYMCLETRNSSAPLITSCWQREIKGPFIFSSVIQTQHTRISTVVMGRNLNWAGTLLFSLLLSHAQCRRKIPPPDIIRTARCGQIMSPKRTRETGNCDTSS